jgi:hypothetical protein
MHFSAHTCSKFFHFPLIHVPAQLFLTLMIPICIVRSPHTCSSFSCSLYEHSVLFIILIFRTCTFTEHMFLMIMFSTCIIAYSWHFSSFMVTTCTFPVHIILILMFITCKFNADLLRYFQYSHVPCMQVSSLVSHSHVLCMDMVHLFLILIFRACTFLAHLFFMLKFPTCAFTIHMSYILMFPTCMFPAMFLGLMFPTCTFPSITRPSFSSTLVSLYLVPTYMHGPGKNCSSFLWSPST